MGFVIMFGVSLGGSCQVSGRAPDSESKYLATQSLQGPLFWGVLKNLKNQSGFLGVHPLTEAIQAAVACFPLHSSRTQVLVSRTFPLHLAALAVGDGPWTWGCPINIGYTDTPKW